MTLSWMALSALLYGTTSKHDVNFYSLNWLHSFRTENKLKSQEKVVKIKIFVDPKSPKKGNILEFN